MDLHQPLQDPDAESWFSRTRRLDRLLPDLDVEGEGLARRLRAGAAPDDEGRPTTSSLA